MWQKHAAKFVARMYRSLEAGRSKGKERAQWWADTPGIHMDPKRDRHGAWHPHRAHTWPLSMSGT